MRPLSLTLRQGNKAALVIHKDKPVIQSVAATDIASFTECRVGDVAVRQPRPRLAPAQGSNSPSTAAHRRHSQSAHNGIAAGTVTTAGRGRSSQTAASKWLARWAAMAGTRKTRKRG